MRNPCHLNIIISLFLFLNDIYFLFFIFPFFSTLGQAQARNGEQQYSDQNVGEWHTERERERQKRDRERHKDSKSSRGTDRE